MTSPPRTPAASLWALARSGELRDAVERARSRLRRTRAPATRSDLHLVCAFCAMRRGEYAEAARELDAARDACRDARPDDTCSLHVTTWRAELAYFQGEYDGAAALVDSVAGTLASRADHAYAAFALRVRIAVELARADYDAIAAIADRAVALAEASTDDYVQVQVFNVLGAFHFERATASLPRHARSHLSSLDPGDAAPVPREAREALRFFERARAAAQRARNSFAAWYVAGNIERLQILLGHAERALLPMRKRLKRLQESGARYDEIVVRSNLAWALRTLGRHREALHELDVALDLAAQTGTANVLLEFLYYDRSLVLDALGEAARARADYNRYVRRVNASRRPAAAPGAGDAAAKRPIEPHFLKRADAFLAAHLREPFTMKDLARHCGVSWRTLDKAFAEYRGVTPVAHVRNQRLDAARRELETGGRSVREAAARSGFGSVTTFSLEFRKRFGVPPGRRRRTAVD